MRESSNKDADTRAAILKSADQLFMQDGFQNTTVRDISKASGASTGSIYHFFKNKDGILAEFIKGIFQRAAKIGNEAAADHPDPYFVLAMELSSQVHAFSNDKKVAALYSATYRSWALSSLILKMGTKRNAGLFAEQLPSWDDDQFFAATMVIKGTLSSLVEERLNIDRLTAEQRVTTLLRAVLPSFMATDDSVAETTRQVLASLPQIKI